MVVSMCLNPILLLSKKVIYKNVEKNILLWNTTFDEYKLGYTYLSSDDSRCGRKIYDAVSKYGLSFPIKFDNRIELPCRNCLECTRSRAREWSLRCSLESQRYTNNYFITLTYRDRDLPRNFVYVYDKDNDVNVCKSVPTLKKEHCFAFMKHLRTIFKREYNHDGIRFFMCGEYGSKSSRPHYHFNIFNLPLDDLYVFSTSKSGFPIYRSKTIERCWKYGFVTVQPFTFETARYTAQYCCKKLNKAQSLVVGREMEYINMSRRPAIGFNWFLANCDKILSKKDGSYNDDVYLPNIYKDELSCSRFRCPKAFYRKLLPVTDSSRGLDTVFINDLSFVLNNDNITLYNAFLDLKNQRSSELESLINCELSFYGYEPDDRYNDNYLSFLDNKSRRILSRFPIIRDSC